MKNKYVQRSRISEKKFKEILKYFALDLQANQIAQLTGISRNSINSYIKAIRHALMHASLSASDKRQIHMGTTLLYGVKSHQHKISVEPLPGENNNTLYKLIRAHDIDGINALLDEPCGGLIDFAGKRFLQLQHPALTPAQNHETAAFWGYTKQRLVKFRGISTQNIYLHLKECEFRYNQRERDLYTLMLTYFRKHPLQL